MVLWASIQFVVMPQVYAGVGVVSTGSTQDLLLLLQTPTSETQGQECDLRHLPFG